MRFLVDANLSPRVAQLLSAAGHDAVAVRDLGLQDAPDDEILDRAQLENRVLVPHDTDFGTLLAFRGQSKPSFVRSADPLTAEQVAEMITGNFDVMADDLSAGPSPRSLKGTSAHADCLSSSRLPAFLTWRAGIIPDVWTSARRSVGRCARSAERNRACALELIDRLVKGHDLDALDEYTPNSAVLASGAGFVRAFPDLVGRRAGSSPKATWSSCSMRFGARSTVLGWSSKSPPGDPSIRRSCWRSRFDGDG